MNNKILIADDDKNLLELYRGIFENDDELDFFCETKSNDFKVYTFEDGKYLLDYIKEEYPKGERVPICILDMRMSIIDGLETSKRLRSIDKNIYIIIVTAYSDISAKDIRENLKDNIYFLRKPFNEDELYSLVYSLLNNWNRQEELHRVNRTLENRVKEAVNEIKEKNEVLLKQSRVAALGEMIGNIAHQWRQPLSALALSIQDLEDAFNYEELDKEYISKSVKENMAIIDYLSNTIDNFRNFFKPDNIVESFDIKTEIDRAIYLIHSSLELNHISIIFEDENSYSIESYRNEFSQVILSLLKNSQDALLLNRIKEPFIKISIKKSDKLRIYIDDNANGIDDKNLEKIFDPYFTTKHQAIGTGLGLYMAKTIIEKHMDGTLSASNYENGARFIIEF